MQLTRWQPETELSRFHEEMDRIFNRIFGEPRTIDVAPLTGIWSPSVDVLEDGNNLIVKADLPGVKKEDVEITTTTDEVTIDAKMEEKKEEKGKNGYYRSERRSGRFLRTIPLPVHVNAEKALAVFKDGMLTLTIPKLAETPKGKKVAVQ